MFNIAVVEDNDQDAKAIIHSLNRYASKNQLEFRITRLPDALKLINAYKSNYDLIFMDIEMPHMTGMEAAKVIRRMDHGVTLVFVTNMAQYAVEGYAVEAFDYILKPINDYALELKLKRIIAHVGSTVGDGRGDHRPSGEEDILRGGGRTLSQLAHPGSGVSFAGNAEVHRPAAA